MASTRKLSPISAGAVDEIGPIAKRRGKRDWEPISSWLADAGLLCHIARQMRQRIALRSATFVSDGFVATRKRNRLERKKSDFLWIVHSEIDHSTDLFIVYAVHDRNYRHNEQ